MLLEKGWKVELVRTFNDPLPQLEAILAAPRRKGARLLVVFDQFEEFVILEDRASAEARRLLVARLQEICRTPPPGLCFLLSFRRDYMSEVIAMHIDDLIPGQTIIEIDAFKRGAARRFLEASPASPTSGLVERILAGAEALDDVPARFRPVTLNMLGVALEDHDREIVGRPERLVQTYIEAAMLQPEIRDIATCHRQNDHGGQYQEAASGLRGGGGTGLGHQDVLACLVLLERKGLVRRLDTLWEISHDFVARQFALALGRLRPSPWRKVGTIVAAGLFVLLLSGAIIGIPFIVREQAFATLRSLQFSVAEGRGGKLIASGRGVTDATLDSALPYLILIGITDLDLRGSQVTSLPSLDKLTALTTLDLRRSQLTYLPSLIPQLRARGVIVLE